VVEWLDSIIHSVGLLAYLLLCVAATLEYVVPPLPGDTIVLLGGVYAVRGEQPYLLVFLAVVTGSVLGAALTYAFGAFLARRARLRPEGRPLLGITPQRLEAVHTQMARWGAWLLVLNRFMPGVRSLVFVAAGAAGLPPGRTLGLGALSAALHTAAVLGVGAAVGGNLERLEGLVRQYQWGAVGLLAVAALGLLVRALVRRRQPEVS
jgi:membrane protein DedA with SNARE-associated domain